MVAPGTDVLNVFVKQPRPGAVKSRLAERIGKDRAAGVYRAIADEEIRRTTPKGDEYERLFFFAPKQAQKDIEAWLPAQILVPQVDGDLGTRMQQALAHAFGQGARRAAVIGTDVPWLDREDVLDAFEGLDEHDVVIGPATDGGYYLLAIKKLDKDLFRDVPWSTPQVLATTLDRAAKLGRSVRVLRTLGDVDTFDDLAADWERLATILPAPLRAELAIILGKTEPGRPA